MRSVVYISSATHLFRDEDFGDLLAVAADKNVSRGVTGVLIYADRCFAQVIEGEPSDIRALFDEIQNDPRHMTVVKLLEENIAERAFPDWSMGGRKLDPLVSAHRAAFELTRDTLRSKIPPAASETTKLLMDTFYSAVSPSNP